jgi:1-acyl-sn-glycerol-3-phosphate acyltransferase
MDLVEVVHTAEFHRGFKNLLKFLKAYFRVEIEGLEHLPPSGKKGLICPNHSGYAGTDAVLLAHLIREHSGRRPRILAHRAFFDFSKQVKAVSESFGLHKASIENGLNIQKRNHLLILFPEGEKGNFKPTLLRYRLQEFRTGFLRIAIQAGAPIIPTIIIGAEESHLNLGNVDLGKLAKGLRIPLPLTLLPLPAKWKIKFLPPIDTTQFDPSILNDPQKLKQLAKKIRREVQRAINDELRTRKFIFSEQTRAVVNKLERHPLVRAIRRRLR